MLIITEDCRGREDSELAVLNKIHEKKSAHYYVVERHF